MKTFEKHGVEIQLTNPARGLLKFHGLTVDKLKKQFDENGLLHDQVPTPARKIVVDELVFVAYRTGDIIRVMMEADFQREVVVKSLTDISWGIA